MPEKALKKNQELLPTEDKTNNKRKSVILSIKNPETRNVKKIESQRREKFKGEGIELQ